MTETDILPENLVEALGVVVKREVDEQVKDRMERLPATRVMISGRDLEPPVVHNEAPDMQPLADMIGDAFDKMRYAVKEQPAPIIDLGQLEKFFHELLALIALQREEIKANRETMAEMVKAVTAQKPITVSPSPLAFSPQMMPDSPAMVKAIGDLGELMKNVMKSLEQKPRPKRKIVIKHGEKESTVSEE